jgi:drug/metabolite transporter superfamily protein YnfA
MLILAGLMTVFMVFCLMARINLKRFLGYPNAVDIIFTAFCLVAMHGTFSGIVAAAFAGVFMSVGLWFIRCTIGAERLGWRRGTKWYSIPKLKWIELSADSMRPMWIRCITRKLGGSSAATN